MSKLSIKFWKNGDDYESGDGWKNSDDWKNTSPNKLKIFYYKDKDNNKIERVTIGILTYENKKFTFKYDSESESEKIEGLNNFINAEILHSFFQTRIPSQKRPNISEKYEQYKDDPIEILAKLGGNSPLSKYHFEVLTEEN